MQKLYRHTYFYVLFTFLFFLIPAPAFASTIYMEAAAPTMAVGDTIIVRVYIDTDDQTVNALDGTIGVLSDLANVDVQEVSVAGSVLTLWPKTPSFSTNTKKIQFTGGVPGGFVGLRKLLFTIVIKAKNTGEISFAPANTILYLNDGKGTAVPVAARPLTIEVSQARAGAPRSEWESIVSQDNIPPDHFVITEVQDPSVYEGKKYLFFQATDAQTGIDHYEVIEGSGAPVHSSGVYILQNQTDPVIITVTAYDKAGNVRVSVYNDRQGTSLLTIIALVFAVFVSVFFGWRLLRRRKQI